MRLFDGGLGNTTGYLALGDNLPMNFTPLSRLHLFENGTAGVTDIRLSNANCSNPNPGFEILLNNLQQNVIIRNNETAPITFWTHDQTANGSRERVRLYDNSGSPSTPFGGGIGIHLGNNAFSTISQPGSLLHIGHGFGTNNNISGLIGLFGWRRWMSVGTFNFFNTDNMYVGLKNESTFTQERTDAVINWGDNTVNSGGPGSANGPDYLRFVYTEAYNGGAPSSDPAHEHGMEVARFSPAGNMGIGNYYNGAGIFNRNPRRRLEVLTDFANDPVNGEPQLRLTFTQQNPFNSVTSGRFSEFQSTSLGDLAIITNNNTLWATNTPQQTFSERYVGIQTATPNNTLEINSQYSTPITPNNQPIAPGFTVNPTGWSGLRFTDLTSASIPQANPGSGVLSVDADGDVVYVPGGGLSVGGPCGSPQATLSTNWNYSLGNFNLYHTTVTGTVLFGNVACGMNPPSRVFIRNTVNSHQVGLWSESMVIGGTAGYFFQNATGYGISGYANTTATIPIASIGVFGKSNTTPGSFAGFFDGNVQVVGNLNATGQVTWSDSIVKTNVNTITNIKSRFMQLNAREFYYDNTNPYNLRFSDKKQYGFVAQELETVFPELVTPLYHPQTRDSLGNIIADSTTLKGVNYNAMIGVLTAMIQEQQLQIEKLQNTKSGDGIRIDTTSGTKTVSVNENLLLKEVIYESDANSKTNVQPLTSALSKVKKLNGVSFNWINTDSLTQGTQYGFIAQQVDTVLPDLIYTAPNGKKSLKYNGLLAWYAEAIQEQQNTIDSMKTMMSQMMQTMNTCCSNTNTRVNNNNIAMQDVELSDKNVVVLIQNVPNPFAEQTTITYNIPEQFNFAQILFYDMNGRMIKSVDIKQTGRGLLNVYANDLSNGIYSYTLVIDGQIIDTKKMVKQN